MKIRDRLIIAFFIMTVLPMGIMACVFYANMNHELDADPNPAVSMGYVLFSLFIILVFTAIVLVGWIYMGMVNPLKDLRNATKIIKEGELDFKVKGASGDEIGLLRDDFDKMRQRLLQNELEKEKKDIEHRKIIRNISHDLKTPITSIKGYVEGILDNVADTPEKRQRYLAIIYKKAVEMDSLIDELSLYSQLDTNDIVYDIKEISVRGYFDDCAEDQVLDLGERGVTFRYENFCRPGTMMLVDPEKLKRVVDNIISNSLKYIGKNPGFIRITVEETRDGYIQIEIEDHGQGISKEDIPYIFDRFFRTDESRSTSTGGSGIGLSIVKKIIEDMGGRVWATSELGRGTTMFIMLKKPEYEDAGNAAEETEDTNGQDSDS